MGDLLAGIEAKLDRAAEHVEEFDADCRTFLNGIPWSIDQKLDKDSGFHIGRFRVWREPPHKLGIVAGEAVGQLRSVLDHLMTAAVRLDCPGCRKPPHFPIVHDGTMWRDETRPALAKLLRPDQLAMVERLQPCKRKDWPRVDWLRPMQAIDNLNKHDALVPAYIEATGLSRVPDPNVVAVRLPMTGLSELTDDAELYRVHFRDEADVDVPFDLKVGIAIRVPKTLSLAAFTLPVDSLRGMLGYTRAVVADFREATPEFRA